jgi:SOS response regulatory protein OraA/RecX
MILFLACLPWVAAIGLTAYLKATHNERQKRILMNVLDRLKREGWNDDRRVS